MPFGTFAAAITCIASSQLFQQIPADSCIVLITAETALRVVFNGIAVGLVESGKQDEFGEQEGSTAQLHAGS